MRDSAINRLSPVTSSLLPQRVGEIPLHCAHRPLQFLVGAWKVVDEFRHWKAVLRDLESEVARLEEERSTYLKRVVALERSSLGPDEEVSSLSRPLPELETGPVVVCRENDQEAAIRRGN